MCECVCVQILSLPYVAICASRVSGPATNFRRVLEVLALSVKCVQKSWSRLPVSGSLSVRTQVCVGAEPDVEVMKNEKLMTKISPWKLSLFSNFVLSSLRTPRFSRDLWVVSIFTLSYRGYLYAGMCSRYDLCRCWLDNWPIGRILSNARDGWKYFLEDLFFPRIIMVKKVSLTKGQLYVLRENFALTRSKFGWTNRLTNRLTN